MVFQFVAAVVVAVAAAVVVDVVVVAAVVAAAAAVVVAAAAAAAVVAVASQNDFVRSVSSVCLLDRLKPKKIIKFKYKLFNYNVIADF